MRRVRRLLCAALLAGPVTLCAQDAVSRALVSVAVKPDVVTLGEPFTVRVRVRASKIATIRFPAVPDSADAIEAVDPRAIEDALDPTSLDRTAVYRLVAWNTGQHTPHLGDVAVTASGIEQRFPVVVPPVLVRSLLPEDSALRVPKAARLPVPAPSGAWRYWLLLGAFGSALTWYWWRRRRARRRGRPVEIEPFVAADKAFRALEALALVDAGEPGRHVIAHVDVLRAYVARRFPTAFESLTTRELITALATADFPLAPERVGALLEHENAVRYAAAPIEPAAASALAKEARAIVRDVQTAYAARLKALDRGPPRARRNKAR